MSQNNNKIDETCLADGQIFPVDSSITGINKMEMVVGPTGCGKTVSITEPRLLHTYNSSLVVNISKKALKDRYIEVMRARGFDIIDLDFTNPESSNVGYDPLDYIRRDEDVLELADRMLGARKIKGDDPYWSDSTKSVVAAEIQFIRLTAEAKKKKPKFSDVIRLHQSLKIEYDGGLAKTNLDSKFKNLEIIHPGNIASEQWKAVQGLGSKTASCIFSMVNTLYDKLCMDSVMKMFDMPNSVSFRELGKRKTVMFITTSPVNSGLQNLVTLMYADLFADLFNAAEESPKGRLDVPVHVICDDFACGYKISDFENYISIFRAAGISATLMLQSESQLSTMYGDYGATTIINNCDTYVYMGGMDDITCANIARRIDKPFVKVRSLPLEQVIVFRRGAEPVLTRRYQTYADSLYKKLIAPAFETLEYSA